MSVYGLKLEKSVAPIVQAGHPVLRRAARPLTPEEIASAELRELIGVMRKTMHAAPGVGLAAPQIGLDLQLAVIEDRPEYTKDVARDFLEERERKPVPFHVMINPTLKAIGSDHREFFEGCLSVQGFTAAVQRWRRVEVNYLNENGRSQSIEASGWYARILQHEIDHLNGTLYIDRMKPRSFSCVAMFEAYFKGKPISEIKRTMDWE